jgi:hypothetical protein
MNLNLALLGLVWLVGLAGVHSVQPQPIARWRRGPRVAGRQRRRGGEEAASTAIARESTDCLGKHYRSRRVRPQEFSPRRDATYRLYTEYEQAAVRSAAGSLRTCGPWPSR